MEAYLDWQKKSAGIKLNDVIEEYKYVAAGERVKSGDLLTYVGEDVAPATEPPFNAIALSSGVGGTTVLIEKEVTKTGNLFPITGWNAVTAPTKYNTNGYTIEASSCKTGYYAYNASDNSPFQPWLAEDNLAQGWVKMTCPSPTKITKMKTFITSSGNANSFKKGVIQGSKDGSSWVDLYILSAVQSSLTEVVLDNANYYTHYRIVIDLDYTGLNVCAQVGDWEVSEYVEKEMTEVIEHKDQVKIARVYKEVVKLKKGNIFPTIWTQGADYGEASSSNGYYLKSRGGAQNPVYYAADGKTDTRWYALCYADSNTGLQITCPEPQKITKMKVYITADYVPKRIAIMGGNGNDSEWVELYTTTERITNLTEITLSNVAYYTDYRIYVELNSTANGNVSVYEWQTSEYEATEVIQ